MSASGHSLMWDSAEIPCSITGDICDHQDMLQRVSLGHCSSSCSLAPNCPSSLTPCPPRRNITMLGTEPHETLAGPGRCSHIDQAMLRH